MHQFLVNVKNHKIKLFHNQTDVHIKENNEEQTIDIITNGERIFNILGYGSNLQAAQNQSVLACEYIRQHTNIDNLCFTIDIGSQAIEWYVRIVFCFKTSIKKKSI